MSELVLSRRRRDSPSPPSDDPDRDPWAAHSNDVSLHHHHRRASSSTSSLASSSRSQSTTHPLARAQSTEEQQQQLDVSRPTLRRLTTETERQVAESSSRGGSEGGGSSVRGSMDLLRMTPGGQGAGGGEVEVLVHIVKEGESLPGIALLYGIDLATLRKTNKLWPSDPVHLRTHLYVPLDACRWGKAREGMIRGPGEGQVTLTPKDWKGKGKGKARDIVNDGVGGSRLNGYLASPPGHDAALDVTVDIPEDPWSSPSIAQSATFAPAGPSAFLDSTNPNYTRPSLDTLRPPSPSLRSGAVDDEETAGEPTPRVLDVVRMPASQLHFFPKAQRSSPSARASMESARPTTRRVESERGPDIHRDLHTLPRVLQPPSSPPSPPSSKKKHSSRVVRLRPPSVVVPTASSNTLASRLSSLFVVPPPPGAERHQYGTVPSPAQPRPRLSIDSRGSARSGTSSPVRKPVAVESESLELNERTSMEFRRNGNGSAGWEGIGLGVGLGRLGKGTRGSIGKKVD